MELIATGEAALPLIVDNNFILDAVLQCISIRRENYVLTIDVEFSQERKNVPSRFKISLHDVSEYGFYHRQDFSFDIGEYKMMKCVDGRFYLSLDPSNQEDIPSDGDQDFIFSNNISVFSM